MSNELDKLRALAKQLPKCLRSDWEGSNHYELTSSGAEFWWLLLGDTSETFGSNPMETESGKRLGLIMDIAEEVCRLKDKGIL